MEFFRKYQRPILYTAVLFALITFSISADMLSFFGGLFQKPIPATTIEVAGKQVRVTPEDHRVARAVAATSAGLVQMLPPVPSSNPEDDGRERLAVLRRQAIELGIEASFEDVDRAIEAVASSRDIDPRELSAGFSSFENYRATLYEAMRIGTLVRLIALGVTPFDHELAGIAARDREVLTVRYARFNMKTLEEGYEKELEDMGEEAAEEHLKAWLQEYVDGLEETDFKRNQFIGSPATRLNIAALSIEEFDPAQWETELEGEEIGDAQAEQWFAQFKSTFYAPEKNEDGNKEKGNKDEGNGDKDKDNKDEGNKDEGDKDNKGEDNQEEGNGDNQDPAAEEAQDEPKEVQFSDVEADIKKRLLAKIAMRKVWAAVQLELYESLESLIDARTIAYGEMNEKQAAHKAAAKAAKDNPDDAALATAEEAAKQALDSATEVHEAAEAAVDAARGEFDAVAAFVALTEGRSGISVVDTGEKLKRSAGLAEIEGLGKWPRSNVTGTLKNKGQMSSQVQDSDAHVFEFQVTDIDESPLKFWKNIKDQARTTYLQEKSGKFGEEAREKFEEALERLGREAKADKIAEIEGKQAEELDTRMTEWRTNLDSEITKAQEQLAAAGGNVRARTAIENKLTELREQLANEEKERETVNDALTLETETEVDDAIQSAYADILEAAATEAGMEVGVLPPTLRSPPRRGSIEHIDPMIQFLFYQARIRPLEEGENTGVLEDAAGRAIILAIVDKVATADVDVMSRRDLLEATADDVRAQRLVEGLGQSLSHEALAKRVGMMRPGEEVAESSARVEVPDDDKNK